MKQVVHLEALLSLRPATVLTSVNLLFYSGYYRKRCPFVQSYHSWPSGVDTADCLLKWMPTI